jgi:hypothetical protein
MLLDSVILYSYMYYCIVYDTYVRTVQLGWSRKWISLLTRKPTFFRKYFYLRVITRKYS